MSAAQNHAQKAGHALMSVAHEGTPQVFKSSHASVCLGKWMYVTATQDVVNHFSGGFQARFDSSLVIGKLVVELVPTKTGKQFSPLKGNLKRAQFKPSDVKNCGDTFPKFGNTQPDSVIIGRDGVLRITLPAKRAPLRAPTRFKKSKSVPAPATKFQKPVPPQFQPLQVPPDWEVMPKDTIVAHSKSSLRVIVGRKLAQQMEGSLYGVTSMVADETNNEELIITLTKGAGTYRLGTGLRRDDFRQITLDAVKGKKGAVPFFGPTVAHEVTVYAEGQRVMIHMKPPYEPQFGKRVAKELGVHHYGQEKNRNENRGARVKSEPEENPLSRLRRLRDEVNETIRDLHEAGDEVKLRVKEDGSLGFTYEG